MVVQHNLQAMNTNRMLGITTGNQAKSTEKLSSGFKINKAADDAAGLAISEKMRSQVRGLDRASMNAQDGISLVQTAEGALNEAHAILQRMNELATQAANDTNTSVDRSQIKKEIDQLASEIDRISSTTQFNTMNLLDGTFTNKNLQVGSLSGQNINLTLFAMDTHGLGLTTQFDDAFKGNTTEVGIDLLSSTAGRTPSIYNIEADGDETKDAYGDSVFLAGNPFSKGRYNPKECLWVDSFATAGITMKLVQNAIDLVSQQRAELGAIQNRLEHTIANLDTASENTSAAESRIRDTDMAKEMVNYSKNNILAQAGQSMLSQANQSTQGVLSLLS